MKLTYSVDPLATKIELEDKDRVRLKLGIMIDAFQDMRACADLALRDLRVDPPNVASAIEWLQMRDFDVSEDEDLDKWLDGEVKRHEEWLATDHLGDCTAVACTCIRCVAEARLGINTIKGLSKQMARYASGAAKGRTIDEAIDWLDTHVPTATWPGAEVHIAGWTAQCRAAAAWMREHKTRLPPPPRAER